MLRDTKYIAVVKWWLVGLLIFLPFQHFIYRVTGGWSLQLSTFFNRLDEITIVIFSPLAIIELYKDKAIFKPSFLVLISPIAALAVTGLTSGLANGTPFFMTAHGVFDYIKYFLVIFIYAAFFRDPKDLKRVFNFLLALAVFLCMIALAQEAWALGNRYILQKKPDQIFYLNFFEFFNPDGQHYDEFVWRVGILRASSFMINSNYLGLYILLALAIYLQIVKKLNFAILIPLYIGIFGSVSRVVYACFVLIVGIQILRGKKWWIAGVIPIVIMLYFISILPEYINLFVKEQKPATFEITTGSEAYEANRAYFKYEEKKSWDGFRAYTKEKAMEIWKDNMLLGVGPSMYGGALSLKYKSPLYKKYNFKKQWSSLMEEYQTVDNFWPMVLAELGIFGVVFFAGIFFSIAVTLFRFMNITHNNETKGIITAMIIYEAVVLLYSYAFPLNVPPLLYSYCALVGIVSGICLNINHAKAD